MGADLSSPTQHPDLGAGSSWAQSRGEASYSRVHIIPFRKPWSIGRVRGLLQALGTWRPLPGRTTARGSGSLGCVSPPPPLFLTWYTRHQLCTQSVSPVVAALALDRIAPWGVPPCWPSTLQRTQKMHMQLSTGNSSRKGRRARGDTRGSLTSQPARGASPPASSMKACQAGAQG